MLAILRHRLLAWYDRCKRDLPWRRQPTAYRVWVSEIMLQQTQVATVQPYYERFLKAFPDVQALAGAHEDQVLKLWEGLGYYRRARLMKAAAEEIVHARQGVFPTTAEAWRSLPGIGRYTAGAIASIACGQPAAILDGNVKRVLARVYGLKESIDQPAVEARLWALAAAWVCRQRPGDFNQAVMELGALVCLPKRPACASCPLTNLCQAFRLNLVDRLPVRSPRKITPRVRRLAAVMISHGRVLLARRPSEGLLGGLWEFPGQELRSRESAAAVLKRCCRDHGFAAASPATRLGPLIRHAFSHFRMDVLVYALQVKGRRRTAARWVAREAMGKYAMGKVDRVIARRLEAGDGKD